MLKWCCGRIAKSSMPTWWWEPQSAAAETPAPGPFQITPCFLNQFYKVNSLISESTNKARNQITTFNSTQTTSDLRTLGCSFINDLSLAGNKLTWRVIRKQVYSLQMGSQDENWGCSAKRFSSVQKAALGWAESHFPWIPAGGPLGNPGKKPALWYTSLGNMTHWITFWGTWCFQRKEKQ